jgi:zinc/manganese transport system substrate-binding protein
MGKRAQIRWSTAALIELGVLLSIATLVASACSPGAPSSANGQTAGVVKAVGAENEYADVIRQIGGQYVDVSAIMTNPNSDPHTFEASPSVAARVRAAGLVVQNGLGYDQFIDTIEQAAPNPRRTVINVARLRGLPEDTPNPHLWFDPATMPAVANALVAALSARQPEHAGYFQANATAFAASLGQWTQALGSFKATYPRTPVATTEPVADYMLAAAGTLELTPYPMQAAIMNGVDPAPQTVAAQTAMIRDHQVKVFLYNQQVTDQLTQTWLDAAKAVGVPVVGVYETMPPGYTYQSWMLAETTALRDAVAAGKSTEKL